MSDFQEIIFLIINVKIKIPTIYQSLLLSKVKDTN